MAAKCSAPSLLMAVGCSAPSPAPLSHVTVRLLALHSRLPVQPCQPQKDQYVRQVCRLHSYMNTHLVHAAAWLGSAGELEQLGGGEVEVEAGGEDGVCSQSVPPPAHGGGPGQAGAVQQAQHRQQELLRQLLHTASPQIRT